MEGRYQCAVLAPYKSGHLDCRMVCFLRQGPESRSSWILARFDKISNLDLDFESTSIIFTCSTSVTVCLYRPVNMPVNISALKHF